ncbi:MAG: citrate lyase subunit alpha [Methanomassiliicoccales archaeon]|nr:MAG: citrate lyase subunit alpha [Methanomassiliicoccales archaeon]
MDAIVNSVGREIPTKIDKRELKPFSGAFSTEPAPWKAPMKAGFIKPGESKILASLDEAIEKTGLSHGMTVSFHHHLRNGDGVVNMVVDAIAQKGIKNIRIFPTALFPVHDHLIPHIESGVVTSIEGSMNGPVGAAATYGLLPKCAVLRSHGGRIRAIHSGDVKIDVAFLAASSADPYGNCNGVFGPNFFGPVGLARADAMFAEHVVIVTDCLVDYPCYPISISQKYVDYVVEVGSIGEHTGIVSGTTEVTKDPKQLELARQIVKLIEHSGLLKEGMSFQAGAGGVSLASMKFLHDYMREKGIHGNFAIGGTTKYLVDMLRDKTIRVLLTGQSFDLESIESIAKDYGHQEITTDFYANIHNKGCAVNWLDVVILGATEVDVDFNVNVNTHSDGKLLHGIGGHQDTAAGAKLTIIVCPLFRKKIPIVRENVTTITTPGETVDAIVTNEGIAINPRRQDLLKKMDGSDLPVVPIEDLQKRAYEITGGPPEIETTDRIIALIEYRDGTIIDVVKQLKKES